MNSIALVILILFSFTLHYEDVDPLHPSPYFYLLSEQAVCYSELRKKVNNNAYFIAPLLHRNAAPGIPKICEDTASTLSYETAGLTIHGLPFFETLRIP